MYRQIQQLRRGVDVVIATPGRLQDLISQGEADLAEVVVTVLDEADFMADLGFLPVVKELLDQTDPNAQRLLFSATLDGEVDSLVRRYLKDPARHEVVRPGGDGHAGRAPRLLDRLPRQGGDHQGAGRPAGSHDRLRAHPARRRPADPAPRRGRHQGRGDPRRPAAVGPPPGAGGVHRRPLAGAGGHGRRRPRHPRRRRVAGPPLRPAGGLEDLHAPLRPHGPRRCRRRRRVAAAARPGRPGQAAASAR